jgi:predicted ATPase
MAYTQLGIHGYRSFGNRQEIHFAVPSGKPGSGLTYLVGPNNSGKSTVIEALNALIGHNAPSLSENKRNTKTNRRVLIEIFDETGLKGGVKTAVIGGAALDWVLSTGDVQESKGIHPSNFFNSIFVLPSRRHFQPLFQAMDSPDRGSYMRNNQLQAMRAYGAQSFSQRLSQIQKNIGEFNAVMREVIDEPPEWHIEQSNNGQAYLSITVPNGTHDSDGLGEGLLSLILIIDSLYDSTPGGMVAIDEPELSLHPALQKKLARLLKKYAGDRQIVIATHSPYFIDIEAVLNGAAVVRATKIDGNTQLSSIKNETRELMKGLIGNISNPHVFGVEAREIFFQEDPVILAEGQDDVVLYPRVMEQLDVKLDASFFGWGVGGVQQMRLFSMILSDLGFKRVIGILDGKQNELLEKLREEFHQFMYVEIPTEDIRTKKEKVGKATFGLLDEDYRVRKEFIPRMNSIFYSLREYLELGPE